MAMNALHRHRPSAWREQLQRDDQGWDQEDDRSEDPHESACGSLIGQRADPEHSRLVRVAGIKDSSGETEKRGQPGVYDIRREEIGQQQPARAGEAAGPWPNDRPPEEDAR